MSSLLSSTHGNDSREINKWRAALWSMGRLPSFHTQTRSASSRDNQAGLGWRRRRAPAPCCPRPEKGSKSGQD